MKQNTLSLFLLFFLVLLLLAGCTSLFQQDSTSKSSSNDVFSIPKEAVLVHFILSNEARFDTRITIRSDAFVQYANGSYIVGKTHTTQLLLAHSFGSKRFQEIDVAVLKNPFQVIVSETSGKSTTITIDPLQDHYVAISFWGDRFEIQKSETPIVFID